MKDGDAVRHYRIEAAGEGKFHLQGVGLAYLMLGR